MVSISKKIINGKPYFYLSHSYRDGSNMRVIEKSLGKVIPTGEDFERIKEDLVKEIFKKRWLSKVEKMREARSSWITNTPKAVKQKQIEEFGIRFTHDSNKIEGSRLTFQETMLAIRDKEVAINKPTRDINEAQYHMVCYNNMCVVDSGLSMDLIKDWHSTLFKNAMSEELVAGIIRQDKILISGSNFVPPPARYLDDLLIQLFKWYEENKDTMSPVLLACLMSFRFVSIHPFYDGNGRMSRLIMNYILYKNGYPMFNMSYQIRKSYYSALQRSQVAFDLTMDATIFVAWFFKNYLKVVNVISAG